MAKTKEEQLAARRAYYQRNKSHIRARDNEAARKCRERNPDAYRKSIVRGKQRKQEKETTSKRVENPDKDLILDAIRQEVKNGSVSA